MTTGYAFHIPSFLLFCTHHYTRLRAKCKKYLLNMFEIYTKIYSICRSSGRYKNRAARRRHGLCILGNDGAFACRLVVNQQSDHLVVNVGSVVPLRAGVNVRNGLAVGSRDGQSNSLIADLVRILGDRAVEPALTDRVLLGSACVEASDDQTRVLAALSQILAVGDSSQEAGDSALVGAEDRNGVHAQQGVGSGLNSGSLGGSGDGNLDDDGGSVDLLFPLGMAFDGDLAGLIGLGDLSHSIDEAGGTAGDGSGDSVLRQAADDDGVVGGRVLHGLDNRLVLIELIGSDGSSVFVVGAGGRLDSAGGVAGNAGVKADDGDVLFCALFEDLSDSVGGQGSQSHGLGVLGELGLDHVDLRVDLSLGSGAVEIDLYAEVIGSVLGALGDCLPELMLEALRHDGDVHLFAGGLGRSRILGLGFFRLGFFGLGVGGFGLGRFGLGGTGSQSENHDQCQKQSDQFFHLVIPPKLFYQTRVPCLIHDECGDLALLDAVGGLCSRDVEQNCADDDCAGEERLPRGLQAAVGKAGLEDGHDEHADERSDHRAGAAGHGRAADDDAGDTVHFLACAGARGNGGVGCGIEQGAHADEEAGERVDRDLPVVDLDAGQAGRLLVGADGVDVAAELGLMQDERCDDEESEQPERADREASDTEQLRADEDLFEPAADFGGGGGPCLGLHLGDDGAETGGHHLRTEGRDEGGQLELGDQNAVGKAERDADEQRQDDCKDQGPALLECVAAQQRRAHHDRAERQVDAAGDDDERHAEGHEADIVAGFENILDRIERQEVIAEDRKHNIQNDQRGRRKQLLHIQLFLTYVFHNDYPTSLLVAYVMMVSCVASEISSSPVT